MKCLPNHPTEESFLKDVAKHEMLIHLDNGVYRHLRFKQPGSSNMWFDIVTWPGHLAYAGDMGTFVFSRLPDMFDFFRMRKDDWNFNREGGLSINTGYWGEKLEAVDRRGNSGGYRIFSMDKLRQYIEDDVAQWIEECDEPYDASDEEITATKNTFSTEIREALEDDVYRYFDDGEFEARKAVNEFSHKVGSRIYEFSETWEWKCEVYTYHYVWCCYALAWAIKQYDNQSALTEVTA